MIFLSYFLFWFAFPVTVTQVEKSVGFPEALSVENANVKATVIGDVPEWLNGNKLTAFSLQYQLSSLVLPSDNQFKLCYLRLLFTSTVWSSWTRRQRIQNYITFFRLLGNGWEFSILSKQQSAIFE